MKVPIVHRSVLRAEHGMIERIPGLDAELEGHLLAYGELLPDRQIGRERVRAADAAQRSRSIAQSEIGRAQESRVNVGGVTHEIIVHPIRAALLYAEAKAVLCEQLWENRETF